MSKLKMSRTTTVTNNIAYDNICIVCYDPLDLEIGIETTKCGHKYCHGCYDEHMKIDNKCAMCRTVLKEEKRIEDPYEQWGGLLDLDPGGRVFSDLDYIPPYSYTRHSIPTPPPRIVSTEETPRELVFTLDVVDAQPCGSVNYGVIRG
jgi:hypothetical protein